MNAASVFNNRPFKEGDIKAKAHRSYEGHFDFCTPAVNLDR
jgi:hypothetical protein